MSILVKVPLVLYLNKKINFIKKIYLTCSMYKKISGCILSDVLHRNVTIVF